MALSTESARIFQLGQFNFRLRSEDPTLLELVSDMFEPTNTASPETATVIDLDQLKLSGDANLNISELRSDLIDQVFDFSYRRHQNCVYMDAAVLVSPEQTFHILAGQSYSGKTTSALSLCLSKGWRLLSEDISYIFFPEGYFCPIVGPLSIREPTWQLIENQLRVRARALVANRWLKCPDLFSTEKASLKQVQSIFILAPVSKDEMRDEAITPAQCLHRLLPLSNLLRMPDFIPQFAEMIKNSNCFLISGGTLKDRVETIVAKATAK